MIFILRSLSSSPPSFSDGGRMVTSGWQGGTNVELTPNLLMALDVSMDLAVMYDYDDDDHDSYDIGYSDTEWWGLLWSIIDDDFRTDWIGSYIRSSMCVVSVASSLTPPTHWAPSLPRSCPLESECPHITIHDTRYKRLFTALKCKLDWTEVVFAPNPEYLTVFYAFVIRRTEIW